MGGESTAPINPSGEIDVSVESVSGRYLDLEKQGKLEQLLRLEKKREDLRRMLLITDTELGQINNPLWLLEFYFRTRQRRSSFGSSLQKRADQLEKRKAKASGELAEIEKQISRIDPSSCKFRYPSIRRFRRGSNPGGRYAFDDPLDTTLRDLDDQTTVPEGNLR